MENRTFCAIKSASPTTGEVKIKFGLKSEHGEHDVLIKLNGADKPCSIAPEVGLAYFKERFESAEQALNALTFREKVIVASDGSERTTKYWVLGGKEVIEVFTW